jgi:hypothetical protein
VRLVAGIVLLAVLCRTVVAEPEEARVHRLKRWTVGAFFVGHSGTIDSEPESGMGPVVELARGLGRSQVFVEVGLAWITVGDERDKAKQLRGNLGARWIARSFAIDAAGAVEMFLESAVGAHEYWFDTGDEIVRPEISLGVGLQARKYEDPHLSFRFGMRVYFAPVDRDEMAVARCAGNCRSTVLNGGILFEIGVAL